MATVNQSGKTGEPNPYLEIIQAQNYEKIIEVFSAQKPVMPVTPDESIKQYKVKTHEIFDETIRKKKQVTKDSGSKDAAGEPILSTSLIDVARVGMPFQKMIVERRVGFMLTEPVKFEAKFQTESDAEKKLIEAIVKVHDDNKMDYKNKEIARRLMSELEVAEIWYFVENTEKPVAGASGKASKFLLKMKVLSSDLGDKLYPLFDDTGDMIAFGRAYKLKEDKQDIDHFDVYTAENEWKYANRGQWALDNMASPNPIPNTVGKIMIVYYYQPEPEWADVQSMINRMETLVSNHADVNDYFGSPILTVSGEIQGFAAKGEQGKIIQLEQGSQANYLALASEPNSMKMELDNLEKFIYTMTQTPNITFDQMKGLGALSGVALRLLFLDAHMAVKNKEEVFGLGLQRRVNVIKSALGKVLDTTLDKPSQEIAVKPILTPYIPLNETELIDNIINASSGGMMSTETSIEMNPLIKDKEVEKKRVEADEKANEDKQRAQMEAAYQNQGNQ